MVAALRRTRLPWWVRSMRVFGIALTVTGISFAVAATSAVIVMQSMNWHCVGFLGLPCPGTLATTLPYVLLYIGLIIIFVYGAAWMFEERERLRTQNRLQARRRTGPVMEEARPIHRNYPQAK
jgi:hypothetical protein